MPSQPFQQLTTLVLELVSKDVRAKVLCFQSEWLTEVGGKQLHIVYNNDKQTK